MYRLGVGLDFLGFSSAIHHVGGLSTQETTAESAGAPLSQGQQACCCPFLISLQLFRRYQYLDIPFKLPGLCTFVNPTFHTLFAQVTPFDEVEVAENGK